MYRKIHLTVDRSSLRGRKHSYNQAKAALADGFNLAIFPEGGMYSQDAPQMVAFKEGAFSLAIENQMPILPVTFLSNFHLLPDDDSLLIKWGKCKIIVHQPVFPTGNDKHSLQALKAEVYGIIQNELDKADN